VPEGRVVLVNSNNIGHVRAAMVGVLLLGVLGGMIATGFVPPYRVIFAETYGLSQGELGTAIALIGIVLGGIGVWQGPRLADWLGRYRLLKICVGLMAVGLAGCGLFTNILVVALFWSMFIFAAYLSIIVNAVVADLWHGQPLRGVMKLQTLNSLGKIAGPSLAALFMLGVPGCRPWRGYFIFAATLALMIFLLLSFAPQRKVYYPSSQHPYRDDKPGHSLGVWLAAALLGLVAGGESALATITPAFFRSVRGLSYEMSAQMLTFHLVALTAGRFFIGILGGRSNLRRLLGLGMVPALLAIPAIWCSRPGLFVPSFILLGLCFSFAWPSIYVHLADRFSRGRSRFTFAVGLMNAAGISAGLVATSWLFESRPKLAMLFGPGLTAACVAIFLLHERFKPPAQTVEPSYRQPAAPNTSLIRP